MYDYINGKITYKTYGAKGYFITVESNGIGFKFEVMPRDYQNLPEENVAIKVYTILIHKEDIMDLCGFLKREERDMFNLLTSVSGVGQKMALTLLNSFSVNNFVNFVLENDYKSLTKAKGVGPKLAQKIILELKDKLNSYKDRVNSDNIPTQISSDEDINDAKQVLISLGYESKEIVKALEHVLSNIEEKTSSEEILKKSLQFLSY